MTNTTTCEKEGCTNKLYKRGVCQGHYLKLLGTPELPRLNKKRKDRKRDLVCTVKGCDNKQYAIDLCKRHHGRLHRLGTTELPERVLEHGTSARYKAGCKCDRCHKAIVEYRKEYSQRVLDTEPCGVARKYWAGCRCDKCYQAELAWRATRPHGTNMRYSSGCKCDKCSSVYSEYKAEMWRNNDEYRFKGIARGANSRSTTGDITWEDVQYLFEQYDHCLRCKTTENLSIDHVVPQSVGGLNDISNLQVLCVACNAGKGKHIMDYRPVAA